MFDDGGGVARPARYAWQDAAPGPALAAALLTVEVGSLSADAAASWAAASQRLEAHLEGRRYAALARFAQTSGFVPDPGAPVGADTEIFPGGEGTPGVSEFAMIEVGIALSASSGRARNLVGDALDLAYRMPVLFAGLLAGRVAGFKVRMILRAARWLSFQAARELDAQIGEQATRLGPKRLEDLVQQTAMRLDPEAATARAEAARTARGVHLGDAQDGLAYLSGRVDAFGGLAFDTALDTIATMLADLGAPGTRDERRADAIAWLANPIAALTLLQRHHTWKTRPDAGPRPEPDAAADPFGEPPHDVTSQARGAGEDRWRPGWDIEPDPDTEAGPVGDDPPGDDPPGDDPPGDDLPEDRSVGDWAGEDRWTYGDRWPPGWHIPAADPVDDPEPEPPPEPPPDGDGSAGGASGRMRPGRWRIDQPVPPRELLEPGLWPSAELVVHISRAEWLAGLGAAYLTGHGPITAGHAIAALGHHQVTITPVIDLDDTPISISDQFTGALRKAVLLANPHTPFPHADTASRSDDDIDHTIPHAHGGPTALPNGGPFRRPHHRVKTHTDWTLKQPFPGIFLWQSPHGRIYLCDRRGQTHNLDE